MNIQKELNLLLSEFRRSFPPSMLKDKDVYADWLAQTYYYVIHSTSLLGYSLPHLKSMDLKRHFEKHLGEETRHDLLAVKDMERLGYSMDQYPEHAITQALYHSQYYRIQFEGGTSLLGYILFLEAMAVHWGKEAYDVIKDTHKHSVLFLKVHAEEDPHHVDNAIGAIMKLSELEQAAIVRNMRYSYEIYSEMLSVMFKKQSVKKAA